MQSDKILKKEVTMEQNNKNNKWIILLIVVMFTFMATLDGSIVNVALPVMTKSLGVSTSDIQLVVTSYLITISALILVFGRLGDMIGKTRVFKFGIALFTLSSLLCGITSSFTMLIVSRILQAIGAAATMANNQGIVTETFPANERGKALGITGTFVALGSLVGPPLGGFLVDALDWEAIFLINVPIGIIVLIMAFKILPKETKKTNEKLDVFGATLFIFTIVPLFFALGQVQDVGIRNLTVLIGLAVAILSFIFFVVRELHCNSPLLQLEIFKNKIFTLQILCGFISFTAMFCSNIIQPFYLQDVMKFSPSSTGLIMMTFPLILSVVAPLSGNLSDKIGSEILTFIGLVLVSVGLYFMSTLGENSSVLNIVIYTAIMSVGNGLFQSPNNSMIMASVDKAKLGIAGSINALIRNVGMVCGIALSTTILYNRMSYKIGYHVTDYVDGRNDAFIYGMRYVYVIAASICLIGAIITLLGTIHRKRISR